MSARTFVLTFFLVLIAAFSGSANAQIRVLSTESTFNSAVISPRVASFDTLPTGYLSSLVTQLNGVWLTINFLGAAPIYAAGSFGVALTTNYLSAAVKDGNDNNVFLEFPANTRAAGIRVVAVLPITFTATSQSGETKTILLSTGVTTSTAGFVGFSDPSGLKSIRVSSPATNPNTTSMIESSRTPDAKRQQIKNALMNATLDSAKTFGRWSAVAHGSHRHPLRRFQNHFRQQFVETRFDFHPVTTGVKTRIPVWSLDGVGRCRRPS